MIDVGDIERVTYLLTNSLKGLVDKSGDMNGAVQVYNGRLKLYTVSDKLYIVEDERGRKSLFVPCNDYINDVVTSRWAGGEKLSKLKTEVEVLMSTKLLMLINNENYERLVKEAFSKVFNLTEFYTDYDVNRMNKFVELLKTARFVDVECYVEQLKEILATASKNYSLSDLDKFSVCKCGEGMILLFIGGQMAVIALDRDGEVDEWATEAAYGWVRNGRNLLVLSNLLAALRLEQLFSNQATRRYAAEARARLIGR